MQWAGRPLPAVGLAVAIVVGGCATRPRPVVSDDRYAPLANSSNLRAVRGEASDEAPLLPEPGDIWAGTVPRRVVGGPSPATDSSQSAVQSAANPRIPATASVTAPVPATIPSAAALVVVPPPPAALRPEATEAHPDPPAQQATAQSIAPEMPEQAPPAAGKATASPSQGAVAKSSDIQVQLIAAGSAAEAQAAWEHLGRQRPDLVNGRSPRVFQSDMNGHIVWRLRTGGFAGAAEAATFCNQVRGTGGKCWVVTDGA